jgi:hypothetical protein
MTKLDQRKIGCLVPFCSHGWCNRKKKRLCALRKFFLIIQKERRIELKKLKMGYMSREVIEIMDREIYFWRKSDRKKKNKKQ